MKRNVGLLLPLIALAFASGCSNDDTHGPDTGGGDPQFSVEVRGITYTDATVVVSPVDAAASYTFDVIEKEALEKNYKGSVEAVVKGYIDYMTQEEGRPLGEVVAQMCSTGDDYYDFVTLDPGTDYVAYAIGLNDSGVCTTKAVVSAFRTVELEKVTPVDCTFRVSVSDVSVTRALIDVEPSDENVPYYFEVVSAEEFGAAASPAAAVEALLADGINYYRAQGLTLQDAVKELRSVGKDGVDLEYGTLKPLTKYLAVAAGIDDWGRVTTTVATKEFTTQAVTPSDNKFIVEVSDVTAIGAIVNVKTTNSDPYYANVFETSSIEGRMDEEIVAAIELTGAIDWQTNTNSKEFDFSADLESNTNYTVIVFGYKEGATTTITKKTFQTEQGGNPADCEFEFDVITSSNIANVGVLPSDETISFFFAMTPKSTYVGDDKIVAKIMKEMEEEAAAGGMTLEDLYPLARSRGESEENFSFSSRMEYVIFAYAINRDFSAAGPVFTEEWTAPEIKVSTATASVKWSKYYDGLELYAYDPELYADGKSNLAYIPTTVEHSSDAVEWYAAFYGDDLTDRSEQSVINNLLKSGEKNVSTLVHSWAYFYEVAYWGASGIANTFCAVAVDADGNYGPVFREVVKPVKSGCSPISELVGNKTAIKMDRRVPFSSVSAPVFQETDVATVRKFSGEKPAADRTLFDAPAAPRTVDGLTSLRFAAERGTVVVRPFGVRLR